jgi:hypothetical protein
VGRFRWPQFAPRLVEKLAGQTQPEQELGRPMPVDVMATYFL